MKWIIVTGDSGSLGNAIAEVLLSKEEYGVIGISRTENKLIAQLLNRHSSRYCHINYDLSEPDGIKELYQKRIKPIGQVFGLVNNSAYAYDDLVTNVNLSLLETMYKVNVFSPMILTKYAIRNMLLNSSKGSVIHITSVSAHTGYKGLSMYASTKGALEAFSKGTAREWGEKGIRSNCISPGFMETAMSQGLTKDQRDRIYNRTSLKSPTSAQSVANMVEFLLSDKASSITGTVMHVDCGTI